MRIKIINLLDETVLEGDIEYSNFLEKIINLLKLHEYKIIIEEQDNG